jgi:hypothetical protein
MGACPLGIKRSPFKTVEITAVQDALKKLLLYI